MRGFSCSLFSLQFKFSCLPELLVQQRDLQRTLLQTLHPLKRLPHLPRHPRVLPQENASQLVDELVQP